MATTPNVGLDLPDEQKTVADEVRRLAGNLVLLDGLIKALQTLVGQKAATAHTHTLAQIAGLVDELAAKMPADRQFSLADLVDVIGSVNAPAGYIFVKRADGKYEFVSSAAAIGTHKHIAADIIDFDDKVTSKFTNLIGGAPAALDTLYELAAALGNDPSFATTVNNKIAAAVTAANNANNNANGRYPISGGDVSGNVGINGGTLRVGSPGGGRYTLNYAGQHFLNDVHVMSVAGDGNVWTPLFGYLSNYVNDRAYAHANERGNAWANDRVANLQYRLVSRSRIEGSSDSSQDFEAPSGAVLTGGYMAGRALQRPFFRYLQVYDPVRGWVGFTYQ